MLTRPMEPRHFKLFTLLDQQNRSHQTTTRLIRAARRAPDEMAMLAVRDLALKSWDQPEITENEDDSAPEPRSNYEFFRAVRA